MLPAGSEDVDVHQIAVVIPVYRGEDSLRAVVTEVAELDGVRQTDDGHSYEIREILLVHDCGPDRSDRVIRELERDFGSVRAIWLSRNFGQHAATLAGMASSASEWIVTMDEDGQHDPGAIPSMLDTAMSEQAAVVYAQPTNAPSHGMLRNAASRGAKFVFVKVLSSEPQPRFHSYRLMLGEVGRSVAAYGGAGVYLDVALGWVTQRFASCPVAMRDEGERTSGYGLRSLMSHFWRLVLSSGTRPLRLVSILGLVFAVGGVLASVFIVVGRISGRIDVEGWASLSIVMFIGIGMVLFSLGLVAEYVGVTARMALGKPAFLVVNDLADGPLGRGAVAQQDAGPTD
jgi:undecaprenyl-phosphate 4-deoxy-4-formamido-L-arabinose transferase